jgi:hypothetical protein
MHVVILLKLFLTKKKHTKEKNTGTHYQPDPRPIAEPNMLPRGPGATLEDIITSEK